MRIGSVGLTVLTGLGLMAPVAAAVKVDDVSVSTAQTRRVVRVRLVNPDKEVQRVSNITLKFRDSAGRSQWSVAKVWHGPFYLGSGEKITVEVDPASNSDLLRALLAHDYDLQATMTSGVSYNTADR